MKNMAFHNNQLFTWVRIWNMLLSDNEGTREHVPEPGPKHSRQKRTTENPPLTFFSQEVQELLILIWRSYTNTKHRRLPYNNFLRKFVRRAGEDQVYWEDLQMFEDIW
jgi:hypothetical protein